MTLPKAYMVVGNVYVNRDKGTAFDKQLALDPERKAQQMYETWCEWMAHPSEDSLHDVQTKCADVIQSVCTLLAAYGRTNITNDMVVASFRSERGCQ